MTDIAASAAAEEHPQQEVKPHRWALAWWARLFRRVARPFVVTRHVRRFCSPLTVEGRENFTGLRTPCLIIANHVSHFDTVIVLSLLPQALYNRTAVVAAADRMYRGRIKGAWLSLRYNSFPITRGGGRAALQYCHDLLAKRWSLLIFPEGKRSRTGELLPFHGGPALLALGHEVPVLPVYIYGAADILPPGTQRSRPAAVTVRVGQPLVFRPETTIAEAKHAMEQAMRSLAQGSEASRAA